MDTLLIVDDDEDSRYILRILLEGNGYAVQTAEDGAQALALARRSPPSMIISDILMPEMDGFTLCREWKFDKDLKAIPFIFYTATYTDPGDEALALSLGAERYVVKPVEPEAFLDIIREVFDEFSKGRLVVSYPDDKDELPYLKSYNASLIRKLEDKMTDLEALVAEQTASNAALKLEIGIRKETERALRRSEGQVRLLLNSTAEAIYGVDLEGRCTFANPACLKMLGYTALSDLLGKNMHLLIHSQYLDGKPYPESQCRISLAFKEKKQIYLDGDFFWRADGTRFPVECWSYPIEHEGEIAGAVVTFIDITKRKRAEAEVGQLAYYDSLTGLPNRALLKTRLEAALAAGLAKKHLVALFILDVDRFKEINDTLGDHYGDVILKQVGNRIQEILRPPNTLSRLGGDEFAILLPRLAATEDVDPVLKRILGALDRSFTIEGIPIAVEISIGISLSPDHGTTAEQMMQRADVALYAAKEGAFPYATYSSEKDRYSPRRLALMGGIREAIASDQFFLHYQPIIGLKTGKIRGVEALIRWEHPEFGLVLPKEFIPSAEKTGLIVSITDWVLEKALAQCGDWHRNGLKIDMAINMSIRAFEDQAGLKRLTDLLDRYQIPARSIELEITESAIAADPDRALSVMSLLAENGIRLSIDDFGAGYTSIGALKNRLADRIKIDGSFIDAMEGNPNDEIIVRSIVDLGQNLAYRVVAEGVERKETCDRLSALGCDEAQGFYLCHPLPPKEIDRWIKTSPWGLGPQASD